MNALEVSDVAFAYGERLALDGVSFSAAQGRFTALLGPNGAGKSTLIALLTRLYDLLNHPPGAFVKPKNPLEYWNKLRFHQQVGGLGAYGLE